MSFLFGFLGQDGLVSINVPEGYRLGIASGIALGLARMCKKRNNSKFCTQLSMN